MAISHKDVVRRLYREVWNERKLDVIDQLISKSHALDEPTISGAAVGPQAYKRQVERFLAVFGDLRFVVEDAIGEKDKMVAVWTLHGTHQGEIFGIAPTNKKVSVSGITIHELADGKILESQVIWDAISLLQQLGITFPLKSEKRAATSR